VQMLWHRPAKPSTNSRLTQVIVADVHLGAGMDGFGLAAVARCRWPGIRTVLISGKAEMVERVSGPPHRFLPKPFRGADLLQAIRD
jgi:CheY-like chemotaxis protein